MSRGNVDKVIAKPVDNLLAAVRAATKSIRKPKQAVIITTGDCLKLLPKEIPFDSMADATIGIFTGIPVISRQTEKLARATAYIYRDKGYKVILLVENIRKNDKA
jgi:hypothetical protein